MPTYGLPECRVPSLCSASQGFTWASSQIVPTRLTKNSE